jgi:hypothetical protein
MLMYSRHPSVACFKHSNFFKVNDPGLETDLPFETEKKDLRPPSEGQSHSTRYRIKRPAIVAS